MSYQIMNYEFDTMADGFETATEAYCYMHKTWSKDFIKEMELKIVREDLNALHNNIHDKE